MRYEVRKAFEKRRSEPLTEEQIERIYSNFWEPDDERIENEGRRGPNNRLLPHLYPRGHQLWRPAT